MINNGSLLLRVACVFLVAPALGFKKSGNLIRPATDLQSTEQLTEEPKRPVWPGQYQVCHKRWVHAYAVWAVSFIQRSLKHIHAWMCSAYNGPAHDRLWLVLHVDAPDASEVALQVSWQFLVPYVSELQSTPLV